MFYFIPFQFLFAFSLLFTLTGGDAVYIIYFHFVFIIIIYIVYGVFGAYCNFRNVDIVH